MSILFGKRATIYRKKNAETWKKIRSILKQEDIRAHASHFFADANMACGCGAHLDPRDLGPNGKIDRDVYFIEVAQKDAKRAKEVIRRHGIVPVVDLEAEKDITQKSN